MIMINIIIIINDIKTLLAPCSHPVPRPPRPGAADHGQTVQILMDNTYIYIYICLYMYIHINHIYQLILYI